MTRQLIVCDVETTGLAPARHHVLEVAAIAPRLPAGALAQAEPEALAINRSHSDTQDLAGAKANPHDQPPPTPPCTWPTAANADVPAGYKTPQPSTSGYAATPTTRRQRERNRH